VSMTTEELEANLAQARSLVSHMQYERAVPYLLDLIEELLKKLDLVRAQRDVEIELRNRGG